MQDANPPEQVPVDYPAFREKPQFQRLRRRQRSFVFPMAAFFLVWYCGYVLLAAFAPGVMAVPVLGNINLGIVLGLLQFVTTFVITMWYVRFADRKLDPEARSMRHELAAIESGEGER